jgi:addiction module HigA family antidote
MRLDLPEKVLGVVRPGQTLAGELLARGMSAKDLAQKLRVPANRVSEIVAGKRSISPETALRLGRYFRNGAAFWINLQSQYDLALAEKELGKRIAAEGRAGGLTSCLETELCFRSSPRNQGPYKGGLPR